MRRLLCLSLVLLVLAAACSQARRYPLAGQVLAVDPAKRELTVKHEDIKGFMPAMTMPFSVGEAEDLGRFRPGDLITATLLVGDDRAWLEGISKTGEAPLPPDAGTTTLARMISPGDPVPDVELVDQAGRSLRFSDWRGKATAVTFVYTRCPLPNFCPLMDRNFLAVQRAMQENPALAARVHLVSVSFDPAYDTPEVLRDHATRIGAAPEHWSYVTGTEASVDAFGGAFGVSVFREDEPMTEIVHNLRTAVVDAEGRLVTILNGNDWKPEQLLEALRRAGAPE